MVWTPENSQAYECDKIAALIVPYTRGKGLDLGCGTHKAWPHFIGVDNAKHHGKPSAADITADADKLDFFADASMDYLFSSHLLQLYNEKDAGTLFKEWARILKPGGYMVLYAPSANLQPTPKGQSWNIRPGDIEKKLIDSTDCGWTQLECEERNQYDEYSVYEVYQKRDDGQFIKQLWERNPGDKKRALVIRYGAIGDMLIAGSILPGLKREGYHITFNTDPRGEEILRHDPHIDAWLLQDKNQVPNHELGPYFKALALSSRYDKIINLCESLEGTLLAIPGRITDDYCDRARRRLFNKNYLEFTHDIADVPYDFASRFYATEVERINARLARKVADNAPVIAWALAGSSEHKVYPFTQVVLSWIIKQTPAHIFLLGDEAMGGILQGGIIGMLQKEGVDTSRIHQIAGEWSIRKTLAFAQIADCVVGPETGVVNSVAFEKNAKVIYLSHSTRENLTKHWKNTIALEAPGQTTPCYPCHRLHYGWDRCHKVKETGAALCASNITPERVFAAIAKSLGAQVTRKVA